MPAIACDARVNRASVATSATMIARPGGLQIERVCFSVRAGRRYWISTDSELTYKGLLLPAHALAIGTPRADDALLAGLLHDIGYWILAQECQIEPARRVELAANGIIPLHRAVGRVIGASHAKIGVAESCVTKEA